MRGTNTSSTAPEADREAWIRNLRRTIEEQENALELEHDPYWEGIDPTHRGSVERFLAQLLPK